MTERPILFNGAAAPEPSCWVRRNDGYYEFGTVSFGAVRPIRWTSLAAEPMYDKADLDAAVAAAVAADRERLKLLRRLLLSCKRAMQASQMRPGYAMDWTHMVAAIDEATTRETASGITPPAVIG